MINSRNDADGLPGQPMASKPEPSFQAVDGQEVAAPPADALPLRESDPSAARAARNAALVAVAAYVAFNLLLPLMPYHVRYFHRPLLPSETLPYYSRLALFHVAPTAVFMLLQLWLARALVGLRWTNGQAAVVAAVSVAAWLGDYLLGYMLRHVTSAEAAVSALAFSLALTVGLTAFGVLLARIVREPNVLLPISLVAMAIDYVGAMTSVGFTNNVVRHAPNVVSKVSVHVPHVSGLQVFALIGPGDALFIAFFLAAVQRLGLNLRGTFWWMFWLLTLAITEVTLYGYPVGALVPMGIAVIAANWRFFRLKRAEVFAVLYAALIVVVVVGAFFLVTSRHFSK